MSDVELRLFIVCSLIALVSFFQFCACGVSLLRVLKVAARDAYSSPRRRLLALDDGVPRRIPGRVMAVLGAFRPFTTQKALLSMLTLSAARECRFWVLALGAGFGFRLWCTVRVPPIVAFAPASYCVQYFTARHASISEGFCPTALFWTRVQTSNQDTPPPHDPPIASERSTCTLGCFGVRIVGPAPRNTRPRCPRGPPYSVLWHGLPPRCDFVHAIHYARKVLGRIGFCREAEVRRVAAHGRRRRVQVNIFLQNDMALNDCLRSVGIL